MSLSSFRSRSVATLLAGALMLSTIPIAQADELIVDNSDASVRVSGPWISTTLTAGFLGSDYLYRTPGGGDATVSWPFPATASAGQYQVFARWTSGPNRASNATYWVTSDAGTGTISVSQQTGGGSWQPLGTFDFQPGRQQGVTLSDNADGVVVADAVRWVGPLPPPAPGQPGAADGAAPPPAAATAPDSSAPAPGAVMGADSSSPSDAPARWTVTLQAADLHAGPDAATDTLASIPQFSYLQVLGYQNDWAYVYNPRARGTAWVPSALLGPSDPPPAWVTAPPPAPVASVEQWGRTVGSAPVAFYPVDDKFAYTTRLGHNVPILVHDQVETADGSTWYRIDQGYLAAGSVRLPRPPTRTFAGRWIDADLAEPAMLTAYEGDRVVLTTLTIKGTKANQTPLGTFMIQRRVADETMDSGTLGVPATAPGGYHLEHVLWTQYFTSDGASIHYNYWSSNFGYSGSHGCLGLSYADSQFLWNWADIGTPVVIRS